MAEKVISYWTSANSLKQLHRFIDSRHPVLRQVPLPDGSNISDASSRDSRASLQYEWAFRRAFIRFLHLPGYGSLERDLGNGTKHLINCMALEDVY